MFAIHDLRTDTIWVNEETDAVLIFETERGAWKHFLDMPQEIQARSKVIQIGWIRK